MKTRGLSKFAPNPLFFLWRPFTDPKEVHATPLRRPALSPIRRCPPVPFPSPSTLVAPLPRPQWGSGQNKAGDVADRSPGDPRGSRARRRRSGRRSGEAGRPRLLGKVGLDPSPPDRRGAAVTAGRAATVSAGADRLAGIDHDILVLLHAHRVLTTPQLIALVRRPERTVDYRLTRLRHRALVERARPYAASGSAPFYWWLTRAGARLVEGTSPAPGKGTPNPLFLRHTAAIAGLYVALSEVGNDAGLELAAWRRDEDAWEDWSDYRGSGRIRPDAYVELRLTVDDTDGVAGAFVEVDFATMDQARLRAKAARHRRYCTETIWWDRHPCCPALLFVTTSEARVNRFLATAEKDRPRPSPYEDENPAHYEELIAACAAVSSPEAAVVAPVWRAAVGDAPVPLSQLLAPEVRQYRRAVTRVQAAWRVQDDQRRRVGAGDLARDATALAAALGDEDAGTAVRYVLDGVLAAESWADEHPDVAEATVVWWAEARSGAASVPPASLVAAWRALYRQRWLAQADVLLAQAEAIRLSDPRLRRAAAALAGGHLVPDYTLEPASPIDGHQMAADAMAEHVARREQAVTAELHALPLHRRLRVARCDLDRL